MGNYPSLPPLATVIVQARMGSSRLPGKMMASLAGRPLIWHILQRARQIRDGLPVVLATSDKTRDDVLEKVAEDMGLAVVRGSEDDVLDRFLQAMNEFPSRWVVRICGDSPLFDPSFLDLCLQKVEAENTDLVKFLGDAHSLFQGGEVISSRALKYTARTAGKDPLAREHVTAWAMRNADDPRHGLKTSYIDPQPGMMEDLKLSIDTAEELSLLQDLYRELHRGQELVDLREAASWLQGRDTHDA